MGSANPQNPNSPVTIRIRVKNVGTSTWNNNYYLRQTAGPNPRDLDHSPTLAPGGTYDVFETITSPGSNGTANYVYQMFKSGSGFPTICNQQVVSSISPPGNQSRCDTPSSSISLSNGAP